LSRQKVSLLQGSLTENSAGGSGEHLAKKAGESLVAPAPDTRAQGEQKKQVDQRAAAKPDARA
jgi:hypothetical protein